MKIERLFYILIAIFVFIGLYTFPRWLADDGYIAFRYAENFVRHGQMTFNVGEDPVEGFTGGLLVLWISAAFFLHIQPELAAHCLGLGGFAVLLVAFDRLTRLLNLATPTRVVALIFLATASMFYTHVYSGFETMPFLALLVVSVLLTVKLAQLESPRFRDCVGLGIVLLVASICRPEAVAISGLFLGYIVLLNLFRKRNFWPLLAFTVTYAIPAATYLAVKWRYYGHPLPNTFYAKDSSSWVKDSFIDLLKFFNQYLLVAAIIVSLLLLAALVFNGKRTFAIFFQQFPWRVTFIFALVIVFVAVVTLKYLRSNLWMNFSSRFFAHYYPLCLLLLLPFADAAYRALRELPGKRKLILRALAILAVALTTFQVTSNARRMVKEEAVWAGNYVHMFDEMNSQAGWLVNSRIPEQDWLVVHVDAGVIPFNSKRKTIDWGLLNDEFLARNVTADPKVKLDYVFSHNPGSFVFTSYSWDALDHGDSSFIRDDPRFANYALIHRFGNSTGQKYYQFVYLRRDLLYKGEKEIVLTRLVGI